MRRTLLQLFALASLLAACTISGTAQTSTQIGPGSQLPDHIGKWTAAQPASQANARSDEETKVLKEAGLAGMQSRGYAGAGQPLTLTIYQFRDPSGAYEALTYLAKDHAPSTSSREAGAANPAIFQIGNFVVDCTDGRGLAEADRLALSDRIRKHADGSPLPPIRAYLPDDGRVADTDRYALGPDGFRAATASLNLPEFAPLADLAGFSSGAETIFARYHGGPEDAAVLLLIDYPTPQLAELHLRHLEATTAAAKLEGITAERRGSLLSLVLKPSSDAFAASLRSNIKYETEVTWNEPGATATDPPWVTVLSRIFIGTGVFMIVAVVLGVAFGGVRVVTKFFFPGKVFDRADQMEILQLGLTGKHIQHRDFY
jgi:hypothetical protein